MVENPIGRLRICLVVVFLIGMLALSLGAAPSAFAHAELRQSSPVAGETVGGSFHQIAMLFFDLDEAAPNEAKLFDPAGNEVDSVLVKDGQKLVIPIDPLSTPGDYIVEYAIYGQDGDFTEEAFTFRFDPVADEPQGITVTIPSHGGFDFTNFALLLCGAAAAAFLIHRFVVALREHKAAGLIL